MPLALTDDHRAIQAAIRDWAAGAGVIAAVRARENARDDARHDGRGTGDDGRDARWRGLAELGLFGLGLPETVGGSGTVVDLAVALEQVTDALVPGPVLPTLLAGLLLAPHADQPAIDDLLKRIVAGEASVAVGLAPGEPVLGAGSTTHLLLGDRLFAAAEVVVKSLTPLDFSRDVGHVVVTGAGVPVPAHPEGLRDTTALLASVEAAAVAAWCVRVATEHARVRQQFGRAIGSFQAVKHLCATMLTRSERASAVAWDAAVAYAEAGAAHVDDAAQVDDTARVDNAEARLAVAVAAAVALDAAVDNAKDCVQVLGGIGFTWEHDAHLYLRRAVALRALVGGSALWRERVAALALNGSRRTLSLGSRVAPDAIRARVREIAALPEEQRRAALAEAGFLTPDWPQPYGLGATPTEQLALDAELAAQGVTRPDLVIAAWAVPTIIRHGTDEQRDRFVVPSLRGEIVWCQLFSEPEAGSDLASLRTRAVRAEGGWRLTGQKVWTSKAHQAHWAICLARTDTAAPKHKGLTYFLVKMDSPGLEIRPLREITGEAMFNEVFLDEVFVPDELVVGEPGDGWRLARGTLENERVAMGRGSSLGEGVEHLLATAPAPTESLGAIIADGLAMSIMEHRATLRRVAGEAAGPESAVRKLVGVAHRQAVAEAALTGLGPRALAVDDETAWAIDQFLRTRCLSIAGGTTQILLTLVGERVLGLPRGEA